MPNPKQPTCGSYYMAPEGLQAIREAQAKQHTALALRRMRRPVVAVLPAKPVQIVIGREVL